MFKELFTEDGGNRGEYNQARREQKEMDDIRKDAADRHEGGLAIARLLIPKISRLTGKQWGFENSASYGNYGSDPYSVMTNPGRLKAFQAIKSGHKSGIKQDDAVSDLFEQAFEGIKDFKNVKLDRTWGNIEFKFQGQNWQIGTWGKKPDFKIQQRD